MLGLEDAYTSKTVPSSGDFFKIFDAWCADDGKPPLPTPRTAAAFVTDQENAARATIRDPQNTNASDPANDGRARKRRHN